MQSAYRRHHFTETVVTYVLSDMIMVADNGNMTSLALLDLSATIDTSNHTILLHRLFVDHHSAGRALDWFASYLHYRT